MRQEDFFNKIAKFSCIRKEYSLAGTEYYYMHSMKMFVLSLFANNMIYFYDDFFNKLFDKINDARHYYDIIEEMMCCLKYVYKKTISECSFSEIEKEIEHTDAALIKFKNICYSTFTKVTAQL